MGQRKEPGMDFDIDVFGDVAESDSKLNTRGKHSTVASAAKKAGESGVRVNQHAGIGAADRPHKPTPVWRNPAWIVLMIAVVAGWLFMASIVQQQTRMQNELTVATDNIDAIGGALNSQGETILTKGSATQDKLKFLDAEMRKLWGVSNDRNKKWIRTLQDDVKTLKANNAQLKKDVASAQSKAEILVNEKLGSLQLSQEQLQVTVAALEESMVDLQALLQANGETMSRLDVLVKPFVDQDVGGEIQRLASQMDALSRQMASVDAHRRQVNRVLEQLDTEIRALKAAP